jgi:N-acetylmuramoyl-L-alanine amidase
LAGLLIGLDAGHQAKGNAALEPVAPGAAEQKPKVSSGTAGRVSGVPEYKVNLAVALLLEQKLTDLGARVLMARTANEVNISNAERAVMMNEAGAALCIRLHANGSENGNVHGAMMLIPGGEGTKDIRAASRQAGEILFRHFLRATGAADAGVIERTDLTGFNWSAVPVCLIEMGFMSNAAEDALLIDPLYQEKCAQGLADGVVAWAGTLTIDD